MSESQSFFKLLFDFSFSRFIGIRIIGFIYGVGVVCAGLGVIAFIIAGFSREFLAGIGCLLISPLIFFLYVLIMRITLEGFVAALRTAENTTQLVDNTKHAD